MRQLRLRGRNVALLADSFFDAGFTPIVDDVVIASRLTELKADLRSRPLLGLTVIVGHLFAVPLTGGSMNPARSFGPALVAGVWTDHWIFWVGPLVGGAVAAFVYEFFVSDEEGTGRSD